MCIFYKDLKKKQPNGCITPDNNNTNKTHSVNPWYHLILSSYLNSPYYHKKNLLTVGLNQDPYKVHMLHWLNLLSKIVPSPLLNVICLLKKLGQLSCRMSHILIWLATSSFCHLICSFILLISCNLEARFMLHLFWREGQGYSCWGYILPVVVHQQSLFGMLELVRGLRDWWSDDSLHYRAPYQPSTWWF